MDRETFARHAGRMLWACAWADFEDSEGRPVRGEVYDSLPPTPPEAERWGGLLYDHMGNVPEDFEAWRFATHSYAFLADCAPRYAEACALEALGHGVSRTDDAFDYTQMARIDFGRLEFGWRLYRGDDGKLYLGPDNVEIQP